MGLVHSTCFETFVAHIAVTGQILHLNLWGATWGTGLWLLPIVMENFQCQSRITGKSLNLGQSVYDWPLNTSGGEG